MTNLTAGGTLRETAQDNETKTLLAMMVFLAGCHGDMTVEVWNKLYELAEDIVEVQQEDSDSFDPLNILEVYTGDDGEVGLYASEEVVEMVAQNYDLEDVL